MILLASLYSLIAKSLGQTIFASIPLAFLILETSKSGFSKALLIAF